MASTRINDFIFIALGAPDKGKSEHLKEVVNPNDKFPDIPDPLTSFFAPFDLTKYNAALKQFNAPRTLTRIEAQAGEDVDGMAARVIDIIRKKTGGDLKTIGTFCAIGSSNSSSLVLSVAAQLKALGAPQLTYVAVTDVTILPDGRKPPVTGVGDLKPVNPPDIASIPSHPVRYPKNYVSASMITPPKVSLSGSIDTKTLRNFFETKGNRVKVFVSRPHFMDWWWWSNMDFGEVHGHLDGADNVPFTPGATDDVACHVETCKHSDTLGRSKREAEQALSEFPP